MSCKPRLTLSSIAFAERAVSLLMATRTLSCCMGTVSSTATAITLKGSPDVAARKARILVSRRSLSTVKKPWGLSLLSAGAGELPGAGGGMWASWDIKAMFSDSRVAGEAGDMFDGYMPRVCQTSM